MWFKDGSRRKHIAITAAAVMVLIAVILTGCEKKPDDKISVNALQEKIENKTAAYVTDLTDSRSGITSTEKMSKYIVNWAESKGIRVKTDGDIIVMNVDGSEPYKDARKTVLVCPYDIDNFEGTMNALILAFYVLKNNEDTGRMTALFVPEEAHDLANAGSLKEKYFGKKTNVLCLNGDEHACVTRMTGGASRYLFSKDYTPVKPKNKLAYKLTISGIRSSQVDNSINEKLNPIVELNTLMANLRSSSIDFEIGSIRGGQDGLLYPGSCELIITVDQDRQNVVENKILSRIESFDRRKQASDPEAVFEYEETVLPKKVIKQKDSSELVGFIYTLLEDEFHRDEDTEKLIAVCDISYIRTRGGKVRIGSNACGFDDERLKEIDQAEKTLCGLSGFDYQKTFAYPSWDESALEETSELTAAFKKAYRKYTGKKLKTEPQVTPGYASAVRKLQGRCDILSVTVSSNTLMDLTGTVMEYLLQSNETDDK